MTITLILGGARSGKSRFAEHLALNQSPQPVYLATSRVWDDNHRMRIERHKSDRGPEWTNIEEEKELSKTDLRNRVIVIDCVTLWLTNYFIDTKFDAQATLEEAEAELDRFLSTNNSYLFVSNEIGQGVHASTESGRKFTDIQGFFNQRLAAKADNVILMVAGIPMVVKGLIPLERTS